MTSSTNGSPAKLTFFEDEMAVRDIAEEIDNARVGNTRVSMDQVAENGPQLSFEELMNQASDDLALQVEYEGCSMLNLDHSVNEQEEKEVEKEQDPEPSDIENPAQEVSNEQDHQPADIEGPAQEVINEQDHEESHIEIHDHEVIK